MWSGKPIWGFKDEENGNKTHMATLQMRERAEFLDSTVAMPKAMRGFHRFCKYCGRMQPFKLICYRIKH